MVETGIDMETNNAEIKAYYTCFKALRKISTYQLIGGAVILLLGFASHTLFLALSVIVAINLAYDLKMELEAEIEYEKMMK